jgi:hypothetical protein
VLDTPLAMVEAKAAMKGEEIIYAEPNYVYQHSATANETLYSNAILWGMFN